jgi:protein-S-isoprenylcysteine O-methyltransferase Ste14
MRLLQVIIVFALQGGVLFISAGTLNWSAAWVYLGTYLCVLIVNSLILLPGNKELIAERGKVRTDVKEWDKLLSGAVSLYVPLITFIVCGLDVRFGWSAQPVWGVQAVALVVLLLGYALVSWAMASNQFFSGAVRIQTERGHVVATSGPYHYVRHPGYTGMLAFTLALPFLLGSVWALIPMALNLGLFVLRTVLEDRTLQAELPGYSAYASQVRYRLLPGIW